jgi:CBS-domain-containing membrane protein
MLVKNLMNKPVIACEPWDTTQAAATLMKTYSVGALPVVSDLDDPLLEGIVTDRDLCIAIVAAAASSKQIAAGDVMTRVPVTCLPEDSLEECLELMRNSQVRRIPVVDDRGRCLGIVSQADISRYASPSEVARTLREISDAAKPAASLPFNENYFYCGQLHESDQIALLERRRHQATLEEVFS